MSDSGYVITLAGCGAPHMLVNGRLTMCFAAEYGNMHVFETLEEARAALQEHVQNAFDIRPFDGKRLTRTPKEAMDYAEAHG